ncbi:alkyl/aryl-sulfatase [Cellulomonas rhizosphaerae]|uniref:MBL fold metallo-hydrolase n=1 Tax=Cellulomonas rhizosphaerae TaxID=2293719 RepID=A0A413RQF5_9CELL|nr:alkyl sulfatase dimerization domain-containing protein [Cellulomonas rhizosphaerae]RHA44151.1 MBL fold metallo-hydrolase [Cellulomonas rhizosphaerae]
MTLPEPDEADFIATQRGKIADLTPDVVLGDDGHVVWDTHRYDFIQGDCPPTANPSLWRQAQLTAVGGLFEVVEGVYQVRGFDISNMSFVEGDEGVVVVDTLMSMETAAAALALYRAHRGERRVTALIITHSHADHYGGMSAVAEEGTEIFAPHGFLEHTVSENVYAGSAMSRRAVYMYAADLPADATGQLGAGLGMATSNGKLSLAAPTVDVTETGQEATVDGVRMVFQVTPGTEAPAEMNIWFPDRKALCMAENATHTLHNLLTLRGAEVRDPRGWARYLHESLELWGDEAEVVFASHHWPTWGIDGIRSFLSTQRDMYQYLHDQTLRLMNQGLTGIEVAERLEIAGGLEGAWSVRGYYGSVSHNIKAIYQRYLGWFDGNPAHLWELPPEDEGARFLELVGGADVALAKVEQLVASDDPADWRWAATVASHVVFGGGDDERARELLARVLTRLGHGAENATWRNFYLRGAQELRGDIAAPPPNLSTPEVLAALTITQLFDSIGVRIDGPRAASDSLSIDWVLRDQDLTYRTILSNGALIHAAKGARDAEPDLTATLTKPLLLRLLFTQQHDGITFQGDAGVLVRLLSYVDEVSNTFPIVTP